MKNLSFVAICVAFSALVSCADNKAGKAGAPAVEGDVITNVEVVEVFAQDVPQTEEYPTTIQANVVNNVVPQNGARIKKINVEIGDYVSQNQILAEMDQANLNQLKIRLDNDTKELERIKELYESGAISKSEYESAQVSHDVSTSQFSNISENTILRSPISGVVTARNYDVGDMYAMSSPIFVIQQITPVKMLVAISETDYSKVAQGDHVEISADAIPGRTFEGNVSRIYPVIDPSTHTFTAEVVVANTDRALRPGMYARAKVTFAINHSIVVPDASIVKQQGSGQKSVFVLNADNTVSNCFVTLGRHFGTQYEILSGLEEGQRIVVKGHTSLRDGDTVNVLDK